MLWLPEQGSSNWRVAGNLGSTVKMLHRHFISNTRMRNGLSRCSDTYLCHILFALGLPRPEFIEQRLKVGRQRCLYID
jgi:hypothetical protein